MIDSSLKEQTDRAVQVLDQARSAYVDADYESSERYSRDVISMLEPQLERDDIGADADTHSQRFDILNCLAHAYNRLCTIHLSRSEYAACLYTAELAIAYSKRIDYKLRIADLHNNIGLAYAEMGDYPKALQFYDAAMSLAEELDSQGSLVSSLGNIGNVYGELFDYGQALIYYRKAQSIAELTGNDESWALWTGNEGNAHLCMKDTEKALECFAKALHLDMQRGDKVRVAIWQGNIGSVHEQRGEYNEALEFYFRALHSHEESGTRRFIATLYNDIGTLFTHSDWPGRDETKAEQYLLQAIALDEDLGTKKYVHHKVLSELYKNQKRWEESRDHFEKFYNLEKSVQNDLAKRQGNILEQKKQHAEREEQLKIERAVSSATSSVLRKMLPNSIADRLIAGEENIADYFPSVSILFADIVGFTPIAAQMIARDVLSLLNFVFNEFDRIMEKHGCQKIKTMGDGYMAVCGAPVYRDDHAERMALAALDLMNDIELPESLRLSLPKGSVFHLRIGLHCGPAFAGIVGEKGFVYDLYSDAVNLASRMESHGEAGKIQCSEAFIVQAKSGGVSFDFVDRGEIEIKGKGKMRTYFLNSQS